MSLLDKLIDDTCWLEFFKYKELNCHLPQKELEYLTTFINNKDYLDIAKNIVDEDYTFSMPQKIIINKIGKNKKRIVYSYKDNETIILKMINYLLYKYDSLFAPNLYSFRLNSGVKKAIYDLTKKHNINKLFGYKLDIKNYFNSISISILLKDLKNDLKDEKLFNFFDKLLSNPYVLYNTEPIIEQKGIMAGTPVSAFLANYYLKDMDQYFYDNNIIYARYADDIIIFAKTNADIQKYRDIIYNFLKNAQLEINSDKEFFYSPSSEFEFLGFSYKNGIIDLSSNTIKKIKGKIRRSARGIRRWMIDKHAKEEYALKAMNRKYNRKFYGKSEKDLTWKYWFFPVINTSASLKEIDLYMQDYLRFIVTGKHNKKNFEKVPFTMLKNCNYKPLVHEYYLKDK